MSPSPRFLAMRERVLAAIAANPAVGPVSPEMNERLNDPSRDCTFEELGFDSLARMEFCIVLETEYGISVSQGDIESRPSVNMVSSWLAEIAE